MKIAYLIEAWHPFYGGGQIHAKETIERLVADHEYEVIIITRFLKENSSENKIPREELFLNGKLKVIRIGPKTKFLNSIARIIFVLISPFYAVKSRPDIYFAQAFLPGFSAKLSKIILKRPIVYNIHGTTVLLPIPKNIINRMQYYLEKILVSKIKYDKVISVSKSFLKFPNINKNISIVRNGIALEKFNNVSEHKADTFKIIYVGRFDYIKGIDILIDAINIALNRSYMNIKVSLVGNGPEYENISGKIRTYNLNTIIELKGILRDVDLIKEYKSSNLFVLPSRSEGFPITILEAWASKIPVLVTDVGDNSDIVNNGENGYLVSSNDANQLADAILNAYNNKKELIKMGENGYRKIANAFTWDRITDDLHVILNNLNNINE